eukprot:TRINITY_DN32032_c0_g1_i1.p1 TRINITY_DN32032_c0_g1~~TRINITY_DN32032_c0_g1_i1.p1  ORF type:complete len:929 (+),score=311.99 TRINITY_DN32032_c0_g1_i1:92-2788(+)
MAFQPNQEHYLQVVDLLRKASDPRPEVVGPVHQCFEEFSAKPDFCCYLAHIFASKEHDEGTRNWAGLVLKNGVRDNYTSAIKPTLAFFQNAISTTLADPSRALRNAAASCAAGIMEEGGLAAWPGLLEQLCVAVQSPDAATRHGALQALSDICEDCGEQFISETSPAAAFVPHLLGFLRHQDAAVRSKSLWAAVELFTSCRETIVEQDMQERQRLWAIRLLPEFITGAMQLAQEADPEVRKGVCRLLLFTADVFFPMLDQQLEFIFSYLLATMRLKEYEALALEACDFWSVALELCMGDPRFQAKLPELVNALLTGLEYGEAELSLISADDEAAPWTGMSSKRADDDDDDSEDSDDEDAEWSLRKCSAVTLELLSLHTPAVLLQLVLPELQTRLRPESSWLTREAATLAIGCVAEAFTRVGQQHIPQLISMLTGEGGAPALLQDPQMLIRSTACWSLVSVRSWLLDAGQQHLNAVLNALAQRIADPVPRVQCRACGAMQKICEDLGKAVLPHAQALFALVAQAFEAYPEGNLVHLYDLIITLAEAIGPALADPQLVPLVLPPLANRWHRAADDANELPALMGAMTAVATALGPAFQPYTEESFTRAARVLCKESEQLQMFIAQGQHVWDVEEGGDEGRMVAALDLLSGLADAVGAGIEALVARQPTLVQAVLACAGDWPRATVRQSALGFCGDLTKWCYPHVAQHVQTILQCAVSSFDADQKLVTANAAWAVGEVAVKLGPSLRSLPPGMGAVPAQLVDELVPLLTASSDDDQMCGNVCTALGRLAVCCPDIVSAKLSTFAPIYCKHLAEMADDDEKDHTVRGLCAMARADPKPLLPHLVAFCTAICNIGPSILHQDLQMEVAAVLQVFKQALGPPWETYFANLDPQVQAHLRGTFGV